MQRCTKCKRTYIDDKQKFCTYDGGKLAQVSEAEAASINASTGSGGLDVPPPPPPPPVPFDPYKTIAVTPSQGTTDFYSQPTGPVDSQLAESQKTLVGHPPINSQPAYPERPPSGGLQPDPNQLTQPFLPPQSQNPQQPWAAPPDPSSVPPQQQWPGQSPSGQVAPPQEFGNPPMAQVPPRPAQSSELRPPPPPQWTPTPGPENDHEPWLTTPEPPREAPVQQWTPTPQPPVEQPQWQPQPPNDFGQQSVPGAVPQQWPPQQEFIPPGGAPPQGVPLQQFPPQQDPGLQNPQMMQAAAGAPGVPAPPKKRSKIPLILGLLALVLILGVGGLAAAFFLVIKPRLDNPGKLSTGNTTPTVDVTPAPAASPTATAEAETTPSPSATASSDVPSGTTKFENSLENLDPGLAQHFVDFSFYYPNDWTLKAAPQGSSNFVEVSRQLPTGAQQENLSVGWYKSKGTLALDMPGLPNTVEGMSGRFAKQVVSYQKVSEGKTEINSAEGYEFRFTGLTKGSEGTDAKMWGRVVFLPPNVDGEEHGVTLIMYATSLAPEVTRVEDVGDAGQLALILRTFKLEH